MALRRTYSDSKKTRALIKVVAIPVNDKALWLTLVNEAKP